METETHETDLVLVMNVCFCHLLNPNIFVLVSVLPAGCSAGALNINLKSQLKKSYLKTGFAYTSAYTHAPIHPQMYAPARACWHITITISIIFCYCGVTDLKLFLRVPND